jgi:hypothetical protein
VNLEGGGLFENLHRFQTGRHMFQITLLSTESHNSYRASKVATLPVSISEAQLVGVSKSLKDSSLYPSTASAG